MARLLWEATVAPSRGRTELERLVDIDSAVHVVGNNVYAVGFQGRVAMLALDTGQIWWAQDASSYRGLAMDDDNVYISTAEGEVVALRRARARKCGGRTALAHRGLSAPVATDDAVAVADFQGYVHWLDKSTGAFAGRASGGRRAREQSADRGGRSRARHQRRGAHHGVHDRADRARREAARRSAAAAPAPAERCSAA